MRNIADKCQELQRRNGGTDTGNRRNHQVDIVDHNGQKIHGDACDIGYHGGDFFDAVSDLRQHPDNTCDTIGDPLKYAIKFPCLDAFRQIVGHLLQLCHSIHHRATGDLAGRWDECTLNGAFQSLEGRAKVFVLDLIDLAQSVIRIFTCVLHAGQHRQHSLFQVLVLGAKQRHGGLVLLNGIFHRLQGFDNLEEGFLRRVTALGKRLHGRAGFQSEGGKCAGCGFGAILCTDVKLLDGVAYFVDAKYTGFRTGNQAVDKLVGGQPQRRILG